MHRSKFLAALTGACLLPLQPALAHGFAGPHMFISTLLIDDPNVADEASLPTSATCRSRPMAACTPGNLHSASNSTSASPRISASRRPAAIRWLRSPARRRANGWQNLEGTLKYKPYVNPEHEFMLSVGVSREFARTGANRHQRRGARQR